MARLPRLAPPGHLLLVILRGNNGQPLFLDAQDRQVFLQTLSEVGPLTQTAVHAYALAVSQVGVLMTPQVEGGLSRAMQALGRAYVRRFNQRHGRTGTLWEGRYRSTVLQAERYLLPAMVALDTWAVREGRAANPVEDPWSSHAHYVGQRVDRWLTTHPLMWSLGNTPFAREAAYALRVQEGATQREWALLVGGGAHQGWALGDPDFLDSLGQRTQRRVVKARAGRPRREVTPRQSPEN